MKYAYYPGCVAEDTCKELDISTGLIAKKLGFRLIKLEEATCCGAGYMEDYNQNISLFLNGRTLALAEKEGVDTLVTVCNVCQLALKKANRDLKADPELMTRTNERLARVGLRYGGGIEVKHLVQVIVEDYGLKKLTSNMKKALGMNVAAFYGCQLIRPPELHNFDEYDEPTSLDDITTALGGTPVDFEGKTKCCGFLLLMVDEKVPLKMSGNHIQEAKNRGADCMVTPCPLCHLVLDMYQGKINKMFGETMDMPILHLTQLIGLALGIGPKELRLHKHMIDASKVPLGKNVTKEKSRSSGGA